ncbi:hypothetical protein ACSBOB_30365 [Mesorhizobium sp. ASY16-5R]|uniref:hypothetical protein n=1 Tax=Mesorhizobium sp. ASY16-5R TaxID=3445772 RepID=UPI003F9F82F4
MPNDTTKKSALDAAKEAPELEETDWDDIEAADPFATPLESEDLEEDEGEMSGDLPEEDDDNAYQESDEALPDDLEERVIEHDPSREGSRFDEI